MLEMRKPKTAEEEEEEEECGLDFDNDSQKDAQGADHNVLSEIAPEEQQDMKNITAGFRAADAAQAGSMHENEEILWDFKNLWNF